MENYVGDNENMIYFFEWVKQLFGESEGKNNKGVLPISTIFPRDLHSLGQFIQDGNKIIFETFITFKDKNEELDKISNLIITSAMKAHYDGHVPIINIELDSLNEKNIAMLIYLMFIHLINLALKYIKVKLVKTIINKKLSFLFYFIKNAKIYVFYVI